MKEIFIIALSGLILILLVFYIKRKTAKTKLLNGQKFIPDNSYEYNFFPWEDVIRRFKYQLDNKRFINKSKCRKCNELSENLVWINFSSPRRTWRNLCGRQGPLSICPTCKIQVQFIPERMN